MHGPSSIPEKANLILNLILIALVLIGGRIWHLSVVQYEEKFEQSKKPQRRTVVEPAKRGTIRDRFNIPLAINKIAYNAAVTYAPIRQIPAVSYTTDENGKKIKKFERKEYIKKLSSLLAQELDLDENRVEDLIYSKAALYFNIPFVLKAAISERQYYRLRMLEKDWPGLTAQKYSKREYPQGSSSADIVGYMGAISREQYEKVIFEKRALEDYLQLWEKGEDAPFPMNFTSILEVRKRLKELESLAYTAQDSVGKTGIEALFEEHLRGFQGKKTFYADSKGNMMHELPGSKNPSPGKRILLSLSQELQEYAESLLAQNEEIRTAKSSGHGKKTRNQKQPWIKGGAIVALDPKTGEILTLATYPRFNPNDFIAKHQVHKWFENETYIAELWDEATPLERERYDDSSKEFYLEKKWISWPVFLEMILPKDHPIVLWFEAHSQLKDLFPVFEGKEVNPEFSDYNKSLFYDCCQLALRYETFSKDLQEAVGSKTITSHKQAGGAFFTLKNVVKEMAADLFRREIFSRWREVHEKEFLKEKREEEKAAKTYPKPYTDYLDEKEKELFSKFWEKVGVDFCLILLKGNSSYNKKNEFTDYFQRLHQELLQGAHPALPWRAAFDKLREALSGIPEPFLKEYLATLRSYADLNRPLRGKYRGLKNKGKGLLEKHLAGAIYPTYGFGYGRSHAYRQSSTQGSIFKMLTAHEALLQTNEESLKKGRGIKNYNPLDIVDDIFKVGANTYVGYNTQGKPIAQIHKGGRIPRSLRPRLGKMDLLHAIETSSNPYFSLLAGDILKNPNDLAIAAFKFGFGKKTGIELPGEIPGSIPGDLETNRTGLYATAIGQHSLVVTPLQTALFLSTFANSGQLLKPQIVKFLIGTSLEGDEDWLYADAPFSLTALGIDFPLFDRKAGEQKKISIEKREKTVRDTVEMPSSLRNYLLEGMRRVVARTHQDSLGALSRLYANHPEAISDYHDFKNQIVGKTSTSESMERIDLDENEGTNLYQHVWFGGISFERDVTPTFENPELVIVVYLRFGSYGKEAAPLAAQIVRKWREIKSKHE